MKVLISKIRLDIPYSKSLKDKRRVLKALKDRIWNKFRASISETDGQNSIQRAEMGIVYVSNDRQMLDRIINKIIDLIEDSYPGLLYDYEFVIEDY
ncbi:MAG: DUF503 domain-containing protein [Spirochaetota bacterium]